ncbi:hypothetical protein NVT85_08475 [Acinetobacter radioresistens]|uniref:hypothetical protein n=1 Tax=Acinetobacter radioresistens TaxID=40216 RepID=UPI002246645B|nr:hypothetical protein [Acinetobacter radioresistens]MCX0336791.1 hypothetical protein [Acinetobacter radioresistens]
MKKEDEKNKGVKNLGPLTLELAKKLSEQLEKDGSQPTDFSTLNGVHETSMHHHVSDLKLSDGMETKVVKLPNLNTLSLSLKEIKSLSDEELLKLLSNEGHDGHMLDRTVQLISNEILIRQIRESSKPDWTVKPTFFLLIITLILTAIPAAETLYDLAFKDTRSVDSHTNKGEKIKTNNEP